MYGYIPEVYVYVCMLSRKFNRLIEKNILLPSV